MSHTDKKHIRHLLRHQRRALTNDKKAHAAELIIDCVAHSLAFQQAQHIAFYHANDGEIDPHCLIAHVEKNNKRCYFPVLDLSNEHHLTFYSYKSGDPLVKNRFGIAEPDSQTQQRIEPQTLDMVLLPLVAFDEKGNRIGRGAGYYDRAFSFLAQSPAKKPTLIGLAYDFQKVPLITPEPWDIAVDQVVTEKKVYW